jgi:hypothetical protein
MMSRFRPSPAMVVALLALFLSLGGVSYAAATKLGTRQIRNGAVTAKKLHKNAVTTNKIRIGAVTGPKLANASVSFRKTDKTVLSIYSAGVPVAGVNVASDGTVRRWFNRVGGAPTVNHPEAGVYQISIPGLQGLIKSNSSISLATLISNIGEIRVTSSGRNPVIRTANSAGVATNRAFNFVVFYRS